MPPFFTGWGLQIYPRDICKRSFQDPGDSPEGPCSAVPQERVWRQQRFCFLLLDQAFGHCIVVPWSLDQLRAALLYTAAAYLVGSSSGERVHCIVVPGHWIRLRLF